MIKQTLHELDFRAARALTWCAFEGTEVEDAMFAMYRAQDAMSSTGGDDDAETVVGIMERWALDHAIEILKGEWSDPAERVNVPICLAHLREHDYLHPDIERKT